MGCNAMLAAADKKNFLVGAAHLFVKKTGDAQFRYVGKVEGTSLNRTVETLDVKAGFPKSSVENFTIEETAALVTTFNENSAKNLDLILGGGLTVKAAVGPHLLDVAHTAGGATVTLTGDQTLTVIAGEQFTISEAGTTQVFLASAVALSLGDTVITLPDDGRLLNSYTTAAVVSRTAGSELGAGGCPPTVEAEARLLFTRPDTGSLLAKIYRLKITGNMELGLVDAEENKVPVEWPILADLTKTAGSQLFNVSRFNA